MFSLDSFTNILESCIKIYHYVSEKSLIKLLLLDLKVSVSLKKSVIFYRLLKLIIIVKKRSYLVEEIENLKLLSMKISDRKGLGSLRLVFGLIFW